MHPGHDPAGPLLDDAAAQARELVAEYVHEHLRFTPFPGEPVGWMMEQAGADLFMFSTDYPHPEGGRDPLAKFEATMADVTEADKHRFYYQNMADLLGPALVPTRSG